MGGDIFDLIPVTFDVLWGHGQKLSGEGGLMNPESFCTDRRLAGGRIKHRHRNGMGAALQAADVQPGHSGAGPAAAVDLLWRHQHQRIAGLIGYAVEDGKRR